MPTTCSLVLFCHCQTSLESVPLHIFIGHSASAIQSSLTCTAMTPRSFPICCIIVSSSHPHSICKNPNSLVTDVCYLNDGHDCLTPLMPFRRRCGVVYIAATELTFSERLFAFDSLHTNTPTCLAICRLPDFSQSSPNASSSLFLFSRSTLSNCLASPFLSISLFAAAVYEFHALMLFPDDVRLYLDVVERISYRV
ncbi:hypothetical protein C8Q78DRAFT_118118 [Trametes maxima]|nr:hypothetical protein C8Q78DRAFT_118118 [Trametes maxima]